MPLLEKVMLALSFIRLALESPSNITFTVKTCLTYFLQEKLELPPPAKALTMVLNKKYGSFLAILGENSETGIDGERCGPSQFYQGLTVDANVLIKKYIMYDTPMMVGVAKGLGDFL